MNDRFKTTNGPIASTKSINVSRQRKWNDRFNTMNDCSKQQTERPFYTKEWNRTIFLTQRNGTDRSFITMQWNGSQQQVNGNSTGIEQEQIGNGHSVARDTNRNVLLTPTVCTCTKLHNKIGINKKRNYKNR